MAANSFAHAELNKLKNIQHNLDQAQTHFLIICCKDNPSLKDFVQKLNIDSKCEFQKIQQDILSIHNKMKNVQEKVNYVNVNEDNTMSLSKIELVDLKQSIENFKMTSNNRMIVLQTNEKSLTEELNYYGQMYETWSKPIEIIEIPTFVRRVTLNKIECPEVKEFDKFLQENKGHTNGWTWDDNAIFLKMKSKFQTLDKVTEKLHKIFPDKSMQEIQDHYNWHEKYCNLRNKQRLALSKWKEQRQTVGLQADHVDTVLPIGKQANKKVRVPPVDLEETKAKVMAWKDEKRRRQHEEMLAQEMNDQFYKQMEIMKFQKNCEIKEKVENWKTIKATEKRAIEAKRREEELKTRAFKAMLANHFIREFQTQDVRFIKKMQACKLMKSEDNKLPPTATKIVIPRDPTRLLKPTKTWISKVEKTKEEKYIQNLGLNLSGIQKLKAPEWRK